MGTARVEVVSNIVCMARNAVTRFTGHIVTNPQESSETAMKKSNFYKFRSPTSLLTVAAQ